MTTTEKLKFLGSSEPIVQNVQYFSKGKCVRQNSTVVENREFDEWISKEMEQNNYKVQPDGSIVINVHAR